MFPEIQHGTRERIRNHECNRQVGFCVEHDLSFAIPHPEKGTDSSCEDEAKPRILLEPTPRVNPKSSSRDVA
jgi:hypothetical protein